MEESKRLLFLVVEALLLSIHRARSSNVCLVATRTQLQTEGVVGVGGASCARQTDRQAGRQWSQQPTDSGGGA